LIICNIRRRVEDLVEEGHSFASHLLMNFELLETDNKFFLNNLCPGENLSPSGSMNSMSEEEQEESISSPKSKKKRMKGRQVRQYLSDFSNVITMTWILSLIQDEMAVLNTHYSSKETTVFLINLLPNRVNLFKKSLYLNQTPNLYQVPFVFIALNVITGHSFVSTIKDVLDSKNNVLANIYDEANNMFVSYFRNTKKLVNLSLHDEKETVLKIKLSTSPDALKVCNLKEVKDILLKKETVIVDPTFLTSMKRLGSPMTMVNGQQPKTSSIFFVVDNKIDLENEQVSIQLDRSIPFPAIKLFVSLIKEAKQLIDQESRRASKDQYSRTSSRRASVTERRASERSFERKPSMSSIPCPEQVPQPKIVVQEEEED